MKAQYFNSDSFFKTNDGGVECDLSTVSIPNISFRYENELLGINFLSHSSADIVFDDISYINIFITGGQISMSKHHSGCLEPLHKDFKNLCSLIISTADFGSLTVKKNGWIGIYLSSPQKIANQYLNLLVINV